MAISWFWTAAACISCIYAFFNRSGGTVSAAVLEGAAQGITVAIAMAGPVCLWSGVARVMERCGLTAALTRLLRPLLSWLYPASREDAALAGHLSANFCANLLGLGNAATPAGIRAAQCLQDPARPQAANASLCRLVVMNTASVQLIPTTVAALRRSAGCAQPMDLLPCVWLSSVLSVLTGLAAAAILERVWPDA